MLEANDGTRSYLHFQRLALWLLYHLVRGDRCLLLEGVPSRGGAQCCRCTKSESRQP